MTTTGTPRGPTVADLEPGQRAGHQEADRAVSIWSPHMLVCGCGGEVHPHRVAGADVEEEGPGQLHGGGPPVDPARLEDEEAPPGDGRLGAGVQGFPVGQEPGCGEEQRADKEGHSIPAGPDCAGVAGDGAEREQQRSHGEQDGDPPAPGPGCPPRRPGGRGAWRVLTVAAGFPPGYCAVRPDVVDEGREWTDAALAVRPILPGMRASYLMPTHSPIVSR